MYILKLINRYQNDVIKRIFEETKRINMAVLNKEDKPVIKDNNDLTLVELKKLCSDQNLKGYSRMKKADLITLLQSSCNPSITQRKTAEEKKEGVKPTHGPIEPAFLLKKKTGCSSFIKVAQLGVPGKEGTVFLVLDTNGNKYAMKTFRKRKSGKTLEKEAYYQYLASKRGISPRIIEYNQEEKYIVMDVLDKTLTELLKEQKGELTRDQQEQIINLYIHLDDIGVMINDGNPLNIMEKKGRLYFIDYGFAKFTDHKDFAKYKHPNYQLMPLGLLMWMRDKKTPTKQWTYIREQIDPSVYQKMKIEEWP